MSCINVIYQLMTMLSVTKSCSQGQHIEHPSKTTLCIWQQESHVLGHECVECYKQHQANRWENCWQALTKAALGCLCLEDSLRPAESHSSCCLPRDGLLFELSPPVPLVPIHLTFVLIAVKRRNSGFCLPTGLLLQMVVCSKNFLYS